MPPILTVLALLAAPLSTGPVTEWSPTNDASVHYSWTLEVSWRPACHVRVIDAGPSPEKQVWISYRSRSGAHIALSVRMNPGDPQERLIAGCKMIDQVRIARR